MFSKPLNQVTCDDVRAFLAKGVKEGKNIDYKLNFPTNKDKIPKTIAAFANTTGGIIIFGVEEEGEKPKEPFEGLLYEPERKLETRLTQFALDVIPPPYIETHVCPLDESGKTFGIIQVPQSSLVPHHLINDKAIYVRTGESARPEDVAHPEKIPWLFEHRNRSVRLRTTLMDQAYQRFEKCYPKLLWEKKALRVGLVMPMFPEEPLFKYEDTEQVLASICFSADYRSYQKRSIPGGIMFRRERTSSGSNLDFLQLVDSGLFFVCGNARVTTDTTKLNPWAAVSSLCKLLLSGAKLHRETGYWGPLLFQFILRNSGGVEVHPYTQSYKDPSYNFDKMVDEEVRVEFSMPASAIDDNALALAMRCSRQLLWCLGQNDVTVEELARTIKLKDCLPERYLGDKEIEKKLIEASEIIIPEANFSPAI